MLSNSYYLNLQITKHYSQMDNFVGVEILSFRYTNLKCKWERISYRCDPYKPLTHASIRASLFESTHSVIQITYK